ncbi:hypothetical protein QYE77_08370 [Thermanaerothrix sp. 4228-RoL]|uniref:Uncharacterized protein n=1 Tax=Thermanaerothrix solaris TaxID=3058434 RepID=A0ABU3NN60_9CHLR|nr:hypothetical protein [Thermanaerothrix sp. 4228-RoL]MDT8898280.1 hypothetical protein [Thermanaerothrix sp. 4228-RoL]
MVDIHSLVQQLLQPGVRKSVGVWFFPLEYLGQEEDIAWRLGLQPLDARGAFLERLPEGATHSGLRTRYAHEKLFEFITALGDEICNRNCLLLYTFDLLLLALEVDAREQFWKATLKLPYLRTKLIIALPENARFLLSATAEFVSQIAVGSL